MNLFLKIKYYYFNNKSKCNMYILLLSVICVFLLISYIYVKYDDKKDIVDNTQINNSIISSLNISSTDTKEKIFVDIKGYVEKEGVYELPNGSRVIDAINISGGFKDGANTRFINLSKILTDGDVIVIYSNEEIEDAKKSDIIYVETPCVCEKVENDACIDNNISSSEDYSNNMIVNINTASLNELITLDGIGEAKATAIINYRNSNGNFNSIEDILNVSGISENIFNNIKKNIVV